MPMSKGQIKEVCAILDAGLENLKKRRNSQDLKKAMELAIECNLRAIIHMKTHGFVEGDEDTEEMEELIKKSIAFHEEITNLGLSDNECERILRSVGVQRQENEILRGKFKPLTAEELEDALQIVDLPVNTIAVPLETATVDVVALSTLQKELIDELENCLIPFKISFINQLKSHINEFRNTHDLNTFKINVDKTFKEARNVQIPEESNQSKSFFIQAHDVLISIFRAFFRLFDYLVTAVTRAPHLMRDSETTFAQKLTGRPHFFEYYQAPLAPVQSAARLEKLSTDFAVRISTLEELQAPQMLPR